MKYQLSERTTKELRIENKLLSVLEDEDSFIEIRRIISNFKFQ